MIKREELTELVKQLVRIESPYYQEDAVMEYCFDWLTEAGFQPVIQKYSEDKVIGFQGKNLICRYGTGNGPKICLNGHLDTVPLCQGWTKPPYEGTVENGRLYGLGAMDMKAGCAALMLVLKAFKEQFGAFDGQIILTLVSDEEGPYGLGTNALIEAGLLHDIDCAVIPEPTAGFSSKHAFPVLCLGARGCFVYCVDFYGKSAHASQPEVGINAAIEAAKFVAGCETVSLKSVSPLGPGSLCVLKIEGDGGACSVPDFARVTVHRHITVGETEDVIFEEAHSLIKKAGVNCQYKISVRAYPSEGSKYYEPYYIEEDNVYAQKLREAVEETCGREPIIDYFSSIGDFNYLGTRLGKVPALIFGPDGKNMHSSDEYVELDSVYGTAEGIYKFLEKCYVKRL